MARGKPILFGLFGVCAGILLFKGSQIGLTRAAMPHPTTTPVPTVKLSPTATPTATPTPTPRPLTETELAGLRQAVQSGLYNEHGLDAVNLAIHVSAADENYATGTASAPDGSANWYAVRAGASWKLLWDGVGNPPCSAFNAYPDFPANMNPSCR